MSYYSQLLEQYVDARHLRNTPERYRVLEAIEQLKGRFTIDEVADAVSRQRYPVSRGTIVNSISLMLDAGLLLNVGQRNRSVLYQLVPRSRSKGKSPVFPLTVALQCTRCGKVKDVRDRVAVAALASKRFSGFTPTSGVVTIYGLCSTCSGVRSPRKTNSK